MKTTLMITILAVAAVAQGQSLVFSNQTIRVQPENLSIEAVEYHAEETVTNTVLEWETYTAYYTNSFHYRPIITSDEAASRQVATEVVKTIPAHWIADVVFQLPRGYMWQLNDYPVEIERFKTRIAVEIGTDAVQSVFGAAYPGLVFACSNGKFQPQGQVRDGFLMIAAQALAKGAE